MSVQITKGKKTALLFGASGLVGGFCLQYLLASEVYESVHSFGRRKLPVTNDKLTQHVLDFDQVEENRDIIKGDDLYCALGTTLKKAGSKKAFVKVDYGYVTRIARVAADNKVNQFLLVSAVGADPGSIFFYNRVKGETERTIKKLDFWGLHIFQPAMIIGEREEIRPIEAVASTVFKGVDYLLGDFLNKYKPVKAEVIARAMVSAAQELESGKYLYPSHGLTDIASKTEELMGKEEE